MALKDWFRFKRASDSDRGVEAFARANERYRREMHAADLMHAAALTRIAKKRAAATARYTAAVNRATTLVGPKESTS